MKFILLIFLSFMPLSALAIDAASIYLGNCQYQTGIILKATKKVIYLLDARGNLIAIKKFAILGIAKYPLPYFPIEEIHLPAKDVPNFYRFYTLQRGEYSEMAIGWPIEFNKQHVQVLTAQGAEFLIERDAVWRVEEVEAPKQLSFTLKNNRAFLLRHPLAFEHCTERVVIGPSGQFEEVRPQEVFDNPIAIKNYLDHLQEGIDLIANYDDRQRFYAVPQVYTNKTLLGTWFLFNSRYSNVGARKINLLPYVQDEYSEGPFGYQRIIRSGVYPLEWSLHEEPILQTYFSLKVDYIRLAIFFDPAYLLIGKRYGWSKSNLNGLDDRWIETGGIKFGFDIKYFSLFMAAGGGKAAVRINDDFVEGPFTSTFGGAQVQYKQYNLMLLGGTVVFAKDYRSKLIHDSDRSNYAYDTSYFRANYQGPIGSNYDLIASYIQRELGQHENDNNTFKYGSIVRTVSMQLNWHRDFRWTFYFLAALEDQKIDVSYNVGAKNDTRHAQYFKFANGVTIEF